MPLPVRMDFRTYRGDTDGLEFILKNENQTPKDLSRSVIQLGIKRNYSDAAVYKLLNAYVADPRKGFFIIRYPENIEAGVYVYDLQIEDENSVDTLLRGSFTVIEDVTP